MEVVAQKFMDYDKYNLPVLKDGNISASSPGPMFSALTGSW